MLKRCHSLKRSQIKIPDQLKEKSRVKHGHEWESNKQNLLPNYKYSNVLLIKSIQLSKQPTIESKAYTSSRHYNNDVPEMGPQKVLQKVKQYCRQIDNLNNKIGTYRQIFRNKQARHCRIRSERIEQNQNTLAELICRFQEQKSQNEMLIKQLALLGFEEFDQSTQQKDPNARRTTATFNFIYSK